MKRFLLSILLIGMFSGLLAEYSLPKAALFSVVVPGSGQLYLKKSTKAGVFFSTELAFLFSYFRFRSERDWKINSYQTYAENIISLEKNSSEFFYKRVQTYFSSEEYNDAVRKYARDVYLIFNSDTESYHEFLEDNLLTEEESWHWQTESNWNKYKTMRREKQDYEIYTNFAVGALILNRVVSVIDAALTTKKLNRIAKQLSIQPDFSKNGFEVSYEVSF
jgi:hypothetical protein